MFSHQGDQSVLRGATSNIWPQSSDHFYNHAPPFCIAVPAGPKDTVGHRIYRSTTDMKFLDRIGIPAPFSSNSENVCYKKIIIYLLLQTCRLCLLGVHIHILYTDFSASRRNSLLVFHRV